MDSSLCETIQMRLFEVCLKIEGLKNIFRNVEFLLIIWQKNMRYRKDGIIFLARNREKGYK